MLEQKNLTRYFIEICLHQRAGKCRKSGILPNIYSHTMKRFFCIHVGIGTGDVAMEPIQIVRYFLHARISWNSFTTKKNKCHYLDQTQ